MTLFLVNSNPQKGEFVFTDPLDNCFTVHIGSVIDNRGSPVSCSCLPGYKDHCIHTLYVLVRVFKLSPENPLVWRKSYTPEQLKTFIGATSEQQTAHTANSLKKRLQLHHAQTTGQLLDKKENELEVLISQIEKDSVCSICHQLLLNETALTTCRSACHNLFHTTCIRVWTTHKARSGNELSCPLCRSHWPQNFSQQLKQDELTFIKQRSFNKTCDQCSHDITVKLFRCLFCQQKQLCEKCYMNWKHAEHDKWMCKGYKTQQWGVAQTRSSFDYTRYKDIMKVIRNYDKSELDSQGLSKDLATAINRESEPPTTNTLQYLVGCFPSVEKEIYKLYKKIDFKESDIKCIMCRRTNITSMRRLYCKHFIDEKCLKHLLNFNIVCCPLDSSTLLQGYGKIVTDQQHHETPSQKVTKGKQEPVVLPKEIEKQHRRAFTKEVPVEAETGGRVVRGRGTSVRVSKAPIANQHKDLVIDTRIHRNH